MTIENTQGWAEVERKARRHEVFHIAKEYENLVSAAEYAAELLGKIPAFGDSLGAEVNKPLLGVAHNRIVEALAAIHIREPHP